MSSRSAFMAETVEYSPGSWQSCLRVLWEWPPDINLGINFLEKQNYSLDDWKICCHLEITIKNV